MKIQLDLVHVAIFFMKSALKIMWHLNNNSRKYVLFADNFLFLILFKKAKNVTFVLEERVTKYNWKLVENVNRFFIVVNFVKEATGGISTRTSVKIDWHF